MWDCKLVSKQGRRPRPSQSLARRPSLSSPVSHSPVAQLPSFPDPICSRLLVRRVYNDMPDPILQCGSGTDMCRRSTHVTTAPSTAVAASHFLHTR
jgi:hypothetical protein